MRRKSHTPIYSFLCFTLKEALIFLYISQHPAHFRAGLLYRCAARGRGGAGPGEGSRGLGPWPGGLVEVHCDPSSLEHLGSPRGGSPLRGDFFSDPPERNSLGGVSRLGRHPVGWRRGVARAHLAAPGVAPYGLGRPLWPPSPHLEDRTGSLWTVNSH